MKKTLVIIILALLLIFVSLSLLNKENSDTGESLQKEANNETIINQEGSETGMANPASQFCEDNEGKLEIVKNNDGSEFGLCNLGEYYCEEWAYFRGECTIDKDSQKIKEALIAKGLNLSDMKVVINKHLGKYIGGSVVSVSGFGGGGYVFAVKEDDKIKIIADGNGVIMCEMLEDYPDFPTYLISECVDGSGNSVTR